MSKLNFISNNANGLRSSIKRIKIFEYLKQKISGNGIIFIQESHSSEDTFSEWKDDFAGQIFFSHGSTNSRGVMIGYHENENFNAKKISRDKDGRILIINAEIGDDAFVLINFYNSNTEKEQLKTLSTLEQLLDEFSIESTQNIIFAGDFNLCFNLLLESSGGNPSLKNKSISKVLQICEKFDLSDIWRIRNPLCKRFTFRKNHFSGFLQRRLDFFFISNSLQESIKKTDILPSFCSDHSPIFISFQKNQDITLGKHFWKFNNSLIQDDKYLSEMKQHIKNTINSFDKIFENNPHSQWEFLKYEIRKFTMAYSKMKAKERREKTKILEENLKTLESDLNNKENIYQYNIQKEELNMIYDEISNGIKIRSQCNWFEFGEKSNKFFLNLEKKRGSKNTIRKIISEKEEITDLQEINRKIFSFYQDLFSKKCHADNDKINLFLENLKIPKLSDIQKNSCEGAFNEKEIFEAVKSFQNNKSPGNDGLTKDFYIAFWEEIRKPFMYTISESKKVKHLTTSQKQAIIKLIEKPNKDKRFISNWRPISLLNFDQKIISKALSTRLKNVLPSLIDPRQTAYVNGRFINESGRLISDIIEICDKECISGYLMTIDFQKAFDSLNHKFLLAVLQKYGFGDDFIDWVKILLKDSESCVLNGGHTTKYFPLQRGARQGDPISAYLFILALDVLFTLIKSNKDISGLNIFDHDFLYTAYADDTTFFLKDLSSAKNVLSSLKLYSNVSGLSPNLDKSEIAGIGVLKNVNVALCGMKSVNLMEQSIKILGVHLSYNKKLQDNLNFQTVIKNICSILKVWRMRNLSLSGKITIFKSLAISKIVYLAFLTLLPNNIIEELKEIQKKFLWSDKKVKIKHDTLCNDYKDGGLKNVDIVSKINALKCSWFQRLYNDNFHEWKIIPLRYISLYLGKNFKFHSSLEIPLNILDNFPTYYKNLMQCWIKHLSKPPITPSAVASQYLWFNTNIKVDKKVVFYKEFSDKQVNFLTDLFDVYGKQKPWSDLAIEFGLDHKIFFKWCQLIHAIPKSWKKMIADDQSH